jgi:hypothetical protein
VLPRPGEEHERGEHGLSLLEAYVDFAAKPTVPTQRRPRELRRLFVAEKRQLQCIR